MQNRPVFEQEESKGYARSAKLRCVHFVGFRDDRYWSAVKVWGLPDFIHQGWDMRARREIAEGDTVVFASGPANQIPAFRSFNDVNERPL